jgi:hypothetical protein
MHGDRDIVNYRASDILYDLAIGIEPLVIELLVHVTTIE